MNRNAVTITDISKRTGLSVYVISRALNGKSGVAQETRSRILKVADEMGYVPNSKAQDLRTGRNRSITLLTAGMSNFLLSRSDQRYRKRPARQRRKSLHRRLGC